MSMKVDQFGLFNDDVELGMVSSIEEQFKDFHGANSHVYIELVRMARQLRENGQVAFGIGCLWEVLRWRAAMETDDPSTDFKLNNNYRSRYARLIMAQEPDLDGFFSIRTLTEEVEG